MWLFTKLGFFSVVKHREKAATLIVRARARTDIIALRQFYEEVAPIDPNECLIRFTPEADYPYRMEVDCSYFESTMLELVSAIDYVNFKASLPHKTPEDAKRAEIYMQVWALLRRLEESGLRSLKERAKRPSRRGMAG